MNAIGTNSEIQNRWTGDLATISEDPRGEDQCSVQKSQGGSMYQTQSRSKGEGRLMGGFNGGNAGGGVDFGNPFGGGNGGGSNMSGGGQQGDVQENPFHRNGNCGNNNYGNGGYSNVNS